MAMANPPPPFFWKGQCAPHPHQCLRQLPLLPYTNYATGWLIDGDLRDIYQFPIFNVQLQQTRHALSQSYTSTHIVTPGLPDCSSRIWWGNGISSRSWSNFLFLSFSPLLFQLSLPAPSLKCALFQMPHVHFDWKLTLTLTVLNRISGITVGTSLGYMATYG